MDPTSSCQRGLSAGRREILPHAIYATIALVFCTLPSCFGSGLTTPNQDARATGRAEAFVADADAPSAVYYNPAGLTNMAGSAIAVGGYYYLPDFKFSGSSGNEKDDRPALLPHFYASSDLGTDRFRLGFGLNNAFGTQVAWEAGSGQFRNIVTESKLEVLDFTTAVAYRLNDQLSVGLGINIYYADADLKRDQLLGPPPTPEGHFQFKGTDFDLGVTPGLIWRITNNQSVGIAYRSPFQMGLGGNANVTAGKTVVASAPTNTTIKFPQSIDLGYSFHPNKKVAIEVDAGWTNWRSLRDLTFHSDSKAFNGISQKLDWMDTFSLRIGTEYHLTDSWTVRGGYAFYSKAMSDKTFTPLVPDGDLSVLCAGVGYSEDHWRVDLAYQFGFWNRNVSQAQTDVVNGRWTDRSQGITATFTIKF